FPKLAILYSKKPLQSQGQSPKRYESGEPNSRVRLLKHPHALPSRQPGKIESPVILANHIFHPLQNLHRPLPIHMTSNPHPLTGPILQSRANPAMQAPYCLLYPTFSVQEYLLEIILQMTKMPDLRLNFRAPDQQAIPFSVHL